MEVDEQSLPRSPRSPRSQASVCERVLRRIRSLVPVGWRREVIELSKLSGPVVLAQLMIFGLSLISTIFCGHLGKEELAGVSIAISVINVVGISIGIGLASACDTLISQIYGGGNLLKVGVIIQRAILILLLACFPCWALLINTESILLLVRQDPQVARISQLYVKIFMPALPPAFMFALESRYLQNQGVVSPMIITGVLVNILNALINYILLFVFDLGVAGSAIANTVSQFSMAGSLHAYVLWKGLYKPTWGGWSKACLTDWGSYATLAVPGMVMLCAEWWSYEIGSFLAGIISEVELGAQSVVFQLSNIAYMFPMSYGIAGCVRVGNALGAGQTDQAKLSAKMALVCAGSVACCFALLFGSLKEHISYIFTYDEDIRKRVNQVMSFYAVFLLVDGLSASCSGVIRGAGKQKVGALAIVVGYYTMGLPTGITLMFAAKLGILGLWIGMLICAFIQCLFLIVYLARMNWVNATVEAKMRAGGSESATDTDLDPGPEAEPEDPENLQDQQDVSELIEAKDAAAAKDGGGGAPLAFRMVVVRRGLTLAAMLVILLFGILMSLLVPNLIT
ncbi:unnamed protein product [Ophioblennius macclurei]